MKLGMFVDVHVQDTTDFGQVFQSAIIMYNIMVLGTKEDNYWYVHKV